MFHRFALLTYRMRKHRLRALSFVGFAIQRLFPFHAAAFQVASASIDVLVNAPIEHAQARMMNQWRAAMLAQLSNVMLIVSEAQTCSLQHLESLKRVAKLLYLPKFNCEIGRDYMCDHRRLLHMAYYLEYLQRSIHNNPDHVVFQLGSWHCCCCRGSATKCLFTQDWMYS